MHLLYYFVCDRHIPLNKLASEVLAGWAAQTGGEGLVFVQNGAGKRFDNCNTSWRKLLEDAGIEDFRWHDMRHHFASSLVRHGTDLYVVKQLLGHGSITMTERYAHLAPSASREAVELLDLPDAQAPDSGARSRSA